MSEIKVRDVLERNITDDLIRIISIVFVIMIHTSGKPWENVPFFNAMITTIIYCSNSFFFMLSGKYNIGKHFNSLDDYIVYYKKKFIDIVLPYVLVSILLSVVKLLRNQDFGSSSNSVIVYYIKVSLYDLLIGNNTTHLWFMFCLMGFIISAPFLSKMMTNMSNTELHLLLGISLFWNFVTVFLFPFLDKAFSYSGWFLVGWITHFCLGYYIDRIVKTRYGKLFCFLGVGALILNILGMTLAQDKFSHSTDLQPTFIVTCAGIMTFIQSKVVLQNEFVVKTVKFIAKYSFLIYMVHFNIVYDVTPIITSSLPSWICYFSSVIVTFGISFIIAILLSGIINPCKLFFRRVFKV
ncbi:acyltransferase [Butyrivibrio fibrisolvens]|uniref:acyltransferase n=1 Tax=Butyrivibrio fibrisolvens TaxID=831 RepID=UPI0003F63A67|nr:acyltransferase [Butyrivibrio fibrisolvens]